MRVYQEENMEGIHLFSEKWKTEEKDKKEKFQMWNH